MNHPQDEARHMPTFIVMFLEADMSIDFSILQEALHGFACQRPQASGAQTLFQGIE